MEKDTSTNKDRIVVIGAGPEAKAIVELLKQKGVEAIDGGDILTPEMIEKMEKDIMIPYDPKETARLLEKDLVKKAKPLHFEPNNRRTRRKNKK